MWFEDMPLFFYFVIWSFILAGALGFIILNGIEYVNWPKLIPLTDTIDYSGPGVGTSKKGRGLPFLHHDDRRLLPMDSLPFKRLKDDMDYNSKERLD